MHDKINVYPRRFIVVYQITVSQNESIKRHNLYIIHNHDNFQSVAETHGHLFASNHLIIDYFSFPIV